MESIVSDIFSLVARKYGSDVETINLSTNGLTSLRGIEKLSSLVAIDIRDNKLCNFEGIGKLNSIREIHASGNDINDISDLRSISSLQFLDLRNNRIREMAQLNVISGNKELTTLLLDGNEICKIRDYHILVFDTIPSLKVVDIWHREFCSHLDFASETVQGIKSDDSEILSVVHESEVYALKQRLKSLEEALTIQERILSFSISQENNEASFPYSLLLSEWRRKVQYLSMQNTFMQSRIESSKKSFADFKKSTGNAIKQHEMAVVSLKELCKCLREERETLVIENKNLGIQLDELKMVRDDLRKEVHDCNKQSTLLRGVVGKFERGYDDILSQMSLLSSLVTKKLVQNEKKIENLGESLWKIKDMLSQKSVYLRNMEANLALERELLLEESSMVNMDSSSSNDEIQNSKEFFGRPLSPEGESLLRAIFQRLDVENQGQICLRDLLRCWEFSKESTTNHFSLEAVKQLRELSAQFLHEKHLSTFISEIILLDNRSIFLTWGELLYLWMKPTSQSSSLSHEESLAIHERFLDDSTSLFPLHLPSTSSEDTKNEDGGVFSQVLPNDGFKKKTSHDDIADPIVNYLYLTTNGPSMHPLYWKEMTRLGREKHFLMKKIQSMSLQMHLKAEMIRSFFEDDLSKAKLRENHLAAELNDLHYSLKEVQLKTTEIENSKNAVIGSLEAQILHLQERLEEVSQGCKLSENEKLDSLSNQLMDSKSRCSKLEAENILIDRESRKKDVRIRYLERELSRLEALQTTSSTERASFVTQIEALRKACDDHERNISDLTQQLQQAKDVATLATVKASASGMSVTSSGIESYDKPNIPIEMSSSSTPILENGAMISQISRLLKMAEDAINAEP